MPNILTPFGKKYANTIKTITTIINIKTFIHDTYIVL